MPDTAEQYQELARTYLTEIMNEENGLLVQDLTLLTSKKDKLGQAQTPQQKSEALNALLDTAFGIYSSLRRWQTLVMDDAGLYQQIENKALAIKAVIDETISDFPQEERHVGEMLQAIDQEALTKMEARGANDPNETRARFEKAAGISNALADHPARSLILSYIRDSLRNKPLEDIRSLFARFGKIVGDPHIADELEKVVKFYRDQNLREMQGLPTSEYSGPELQDLINAHILPDPAPVGGQPVLYRKLMNLASNLYARMLEHNTLADSNLGDNIIPLTFADIVAEAQLVFTNLDGPPEGAKTVLDLLVNTSDNAEDARVELSQKLEGSLLNAAVSDYPNNRLRGGNTLVISPRVPRARKSSFRKRHSRFLRRHGEVRPRPHASRCPGGRLLPGYALFRDPPHPQSAGGTLDRRRTNTIDQPPPQRRGIA